MNADNVIKPGKTWLICEYLKLTFWAVPSAFLGWIWVEITDGLSLSPKIQNEGPKATEQKSKVWNQRIENKQTLNN